MSSEVEAEMMQPGLTHLQDVLGDDVVVLDVSGSEWLEVADEQQMWTIKGMTDFANKASFNAASQAGGNQPPSWVWLASPQ